MRTLLFTLLFSGATLIISGCSFPFDVTEEDQTTKILVGTSFYVLEEFTKQVGGEHVEFITPPVGSGGHSYSPTPQDTAGLYTADLFIYQGESFDPWAEKLANDLNDSGVRVVQVTADMSLRPFVESEEEQDEFDPHTWTDPVLAIVMVETIRDALQEIDPVNTEYYSTNANDYITELNALDKAYTSGLANCDINTVVIAHDAFAYMAARYGFSAEGIAGFSPDARPSAKHLAELSELIQTTGTKYIFFETLASPDLANTLATDAGIHTLVLNPLEGLTDAEVAAGENYISVMYTNLHNLQQAMQCQNQP